VETRQHNHHVAFDDIEESIRKLPQENATHVFVDLMVGERITLDERQASIDGTQKF